MSVRQRKLRSQDDEPPSQDFSWTRRTTSLSGIGGGGLARKYLALTLLLGVLFLGYIAIVNDLKPIHLGSKAIDSLAFSFSFQKAVYIVIIDAGSTGSRLLVYSFHASILDGNLVLDNELFYEIKPGLSSFVNNPRNAARSLEKLLKKAKEVIPKAEWHKTMLSMKATAGLRLLPESKANSILQECKKLFETSGFRISKNSVSIMEGVDEGIFSWFTVNFLLDKFHNSYSSSKSVAALDLGGGSTQVTFVPDNQDIKKLEKYVYSINAFNNNMSVYTHSYLGMGLMAARKEILVQSDPKNVSKKSEDQKSVIEVRSECINPIVSSEWSYEGQDYLVRGPVNGGHKVVKTQNFAAGNEDRPIVRFRECQRIVENYVSTITNKPIGLNSYEVYAFSYYFDRATEVGLIDPFFGGVITLDNLHKTTMETCDYPNTDQPFMCLDLTYIYVLLKNGFNLDPTTKLFLYKKINDHELSWALGAAFNVLENEV